MAPVVFALGEKYQITGMTGVFGAAVAAGILLDLNEDGAEASCFIAHATGSLEKPMTREALERKFKR